MKNILIICLGIFFIGKYGISQVYSDLEAKAILNELGISSSKMIRDADLIIVVKNQIAGVGGLCIDLPILDFIKDDQIVLLPGVEGFVTKKGSIIIEGSYLYVSAVIHRVGLKKYLIAGPSLKDIANYLLKLR